MIKNMMNLLITFNARIPTYSDEVHNNIYLIYSEEDDKCYWNTDYVF